MRIGIDASRAFLKERTGIEEYSYQVVKILRGRLENHQVVLYLRNGQAVDFELPKNWRIKFINWPYFWTQIGLALEMLFHPVDVLFVPSHVVPLVHPARTVVTVHGLEYEVLPEAYSAWEKLYMRLSIKKSCRAASHIIAVSENTRKDLMRLYKVPSDKIRVIYEGAANRNFQFPISNFQSNPNDQISNSKIETSLENSKFLLFVGRLEERKNITGIMRAFEILKERDHIPHQLVLAGKWGYGERMICEEMANGKYRPDILCLGYVSEEEKYALLERADVFLFPTFYEGFGLPILEAQSVGTPVVTSNVSSLPEVGGESAVYCDPAEPVSIAEAIHSIISNPTQKNDIIKKGLENVKRFSWDKCAKEITEILEGKVDK